MNIDGSNERMVKSFHVEGPKWSPNGKNLIYYKQKEHQQMVAVESLVCT